MFCLRAPPSALHRKGIMTAWSFLELWKISPSTLFQMTLATILMAPVLGDCGPPPSLQFASPINQLYETTFSTGTVLKYTCHRGFKKVNSSHLTCDENGSWVYSIFCAKKRCRNPGELVNGKVEITTDLFLGSSIEFSCAKGYLLIGSATSRCEVQGKGVDWSDSLPECVKTICHQPEIPNGDLFPGLQQYYTYRDSVEVKCKKGYALRGSSLIHCEANSKWFPSVPTCEPNGCIDMPDIPYAFWEPNKFPLRNFEIFEVGTKLKYQCKPGYRALPNDPQIVICQENLTWSSSKGCERVCCPTPNMDKIKIVSERRDFTGICVYAYGDYVFYICGEGSYPMSTDGRSSCQADGKWDPAIPACQMDLQNHPAVTASNLMETGTKDNKYLSDNEESLRYLSVKGMCPKPVIIHGNLSVEKNHYAEMENITVLCDLGYDLVGSPNIICSENKTWYPDIPSCKLGVLEDCKQVNEGRKLFHCLSNPEDVKRALELYKLSLEITRLEEEKEKWTRFHRKPSKHVKIKEPFRPFG
ncbi:Zp3r [Phodopus roborovskii]|uniref:Zona pellucida sperm-binding protein 3 receptor n=1 Tax=Phodopus roborovskii TaxID=109678 RepID=A0AAV0A2K4_PHORO|nr:Zp3r [Phodopus roborovskii]